MTDTNIEVVATEATEESAKKSPAKKTTTTKKTTTAKAEGTTTAKKTTTKKATAEGETPAKKTTAKKTPAKKVEAVEEVVATEAEVVAPVKKAPAKKAPAKKKAVKAKAPLYINGRYVAEKTFAAKPAKGDHPYELTNNMIKITLVKSLHGRLDKQQRTLVALGLTKINHSVVKADNKAIRGMIFVVKHLVTVEEVK